MSAGLRHLLACALLFAALAVRADATNYQPLDYADLGPTRLLDGGHAGIALVLADKDTMAAAETIAGAITARGQSAALVDIEIFLARMAAAHTQCIDAVTLLDVYAQQVQQTLRFDRSSKPALIGTGQGAAFVPLLLAQARAGLFGASVSAGAVAPLRLPAPPCGALALQPGWRSPDIALEIPADLVLHAPWRASTDPSATSVLDALDGLSAAQETSAGAAPDLPLVELPQPGGGSAPWIAIVLSGDGGWANIDKDIAEELGRQGIAVLGWNSLRYFWERKTPEQSAQDMAALVRWVTQAWGKPKVLLIGFSLGAEVLPFMASRAPPDVRAAIAGLVLLNPAESVDFQFHISDWLGGGEAAAYALAPELRKIGDVPVLCLYGSEDDPGLCPTLAGHAGITVRGLPGDHHFDGDYATLTRLILAQFPR